MTRDPIDSVFEEISRCIGRKRYWMCAVFGVAVGSLVRVMQALERIAGDDLDVHFIVVVFVEEGAVACASDSAGLHRSAHAAVENVLNLSRDLGSEDGRCGLASRYLELQSPTLDGYIGCGVELRVWG